MRILEALLLAVAALALWLVFFDFLLSSMPKANLQYLTFDVSKYWWPWLLVLAATLAGYVATRRR